MNMFFHHVNRTEIIAQPKFFVDQDVFPQTRDLILTRAIPIGIEVVFGDYRKANINSEFFGALVQ